jgi:hypothetical protein
LVNVNTEKVLGSSPSLIILFLYFYSFENIGLFFRRVFGTSLVIVERQGVNKKDKAREI